MARPTKLTKELQQQIGENVALGLTYALSSTAAGITYQTFNDWMNKGKNSKSGEYFEFYKHIQKCNADTALKCLERLKKVVDEGDCRAAMWILERRFHADFGRRDYRKINAVTENKNENFEILVNDADKIRERIIEKFALVRKELEPLNVLIF